VIFHLAAIVSGDAEANFEKGYKINFNGSWALFEAIRRSGRRAAKMVAKMVVRPAATSRASSSPRLLAVIGPPFPDPVPDSLATTPTTSYGTQKAMTELLLADYSRKGYLDGVGVRLPTICIRPANPTRRRRASSPVSCASRWRARKHCCRWAMTCATGLPARAPPSASSSPPPPRHRNAGPARSMTMPGVSATVGEQIAALRKAAGDKAVALIKRVEDPFRGQNRAGMGGTL